MRIFKKSCEIAEKMGGLGLIWTVPPHRSPFAKAPGRGPPASPNPAGLRPPRVSSGSLEHRSPSALVGDTVRMRPARCILGAQICFRHSSVPPANGSLLLIRVGLDSGMFPNQEVKNHKPGHRAKARHKSLANAPAAAPVHRGTSPHHISFSIARCPGLCCAGFAQRSFKSSESRAKGLAGDSPGLSPGGKGAL